MVFIEKIQNLLEKIQQEEQPTINQAVKACAASIKAGRAVLTFGAGHSALPPQEAFPRIGSIPGFVQITEPVFGFNGFVTGKGGQRQMSFLEQTSGYAEVILSNYALTPEDTLIVFSNSGINALPVELCWLAKSQGLTTISIGSRAHALANQPKNPLGQRLLEISDIHIDNHSPVGDTLITLEGGLHTGGSSTITSMAIMNTIIVETIRELQASGIYVTAYPSHNVSGDLATVEAQEHAVLQAHRDVMAKLQ